MSMHPSDLTPSDEAGLREQIKQLIDRQRPYDHYWLGSWDDLQAQIDASPLDRITHAVDEHLAPDNMPLGDDWNNNLQEIKGCVYDFVRLAAAAATKA